MRRFLLAVSVFFLLVHATVTQDEARQWREDVRFAAAELEKLHANLYHSISRDDFARRIAQLDARIPSLQRHEIIAELATIVAAVGDGHTNVAPARDPKVGFRTLPVVFYWFADGLYVRAAHESVKEIVGTKVLAIGKMTPEAAYGAMKPAISRDNEQGVRHWSAIYFSMPELLAAMKIVDDMESVPLTVERNGKPFTTTLHPLAPFPLLPADTDLTWARRDGWVDARGANDPLWLRDPNAEIRSEMLPDGKTLYVQLNRIDSGLTEFAPKLRERLKRGEADALVIDLRLNRGGHGEMNVPLLRAIIASEAIDQPGHLFLIIGRATYSAAQFTLDDFERYANVTFVGEPSGSRGNAYGDSRKITLPNSGLTVRGSIYYWQKWDPWDKREATEPQIAAPLTFDQYRRNIDPALDAIAKTLKR